MPSDHSRLLLLAQRAAGRPQSQLEQALEASRVAVSVDPGMPAAALTARVLLTTLRRAPGELVLERGALSAASADHLAAAVAAVDPGRPLSITHGTDNACSVRLHVGASAARAIRIVPEGYGAHIAGQNTAVIRPARPANAIGAVYAAALGAAEAFKRTADVLPGRRVLHRHLRFCPVTLTSDLGAAPDLPPRLGLDLALIGVGAVGTGIVLLLDAINATGRLLAVDRQQFGPENRGTYSLGGEAEVRSAPWKTDIACSALPRFDVTPFRGPIAQLPAAIDNAAIPWFRTVLTALDTPEARREAQHLWPDRLIDAATGDTMLGIHDHEHGTGPCLICSFPPERSGTSAARRLADQTGLPLKRVMRGDDPLTEEESRGPDGRTAAATPAAPRQASMRPGPGRRPDRTRRRRVPALGPVRIPAGRLPVHRPAHRKPARCQCRSKPRAVRRAIRSPDGNSRTDEPSPGLLLPIPRRNHRTRKADAGIPPGMTRKQLATDCPPYRARPQIHNGAGTGRCRSTPGGPRICAFCRECHTAPT